jgi:hypothetical protein
VDLQFPYFFYANQIRCVDKNLKISKKKKKNFFF